MNYDKEYAQNPFKTGEIKQNPNIRVEKINDFDKYKNNRFYNNNSDLFNKRTSHETTVKNEIKYVYGKGFVMIMDSY